MVDGLREVMAEKRTRFNTTPFTDRAVAQTDASLDTSTVDKLVFGYRVTAFFPCTLITNLA